MTNVPGPRFCRQEKYVDIALARREARHNDAVCHHARDTGEVVSCLPILEVDRVNRNWVATFM